MIRVLLILATILAGCAEAPTQPSTAAQAENQPNETPIEQPPTPTDMPQPAQIGDWINGTHLNAKLTHATPRTRITADAEYHYAEYEFDLAFVEPPEGLRVVLTPHPDIGGTSMELSGQPENWTGQLSGKMPPNVRLHLMVDNVPTGESYVWSTSA